MIPFKPVVLVILAVVPYLRAVHGEFLFDDPWMFSPMHIGYPATIWGLRGFHQDVRAVVHLLDAILFRLVGVNETGMDASGTVIIQPAFWWHVLSLAFHAGTTLCVWALAGHFLEPSRAFLAAAIFAVHPLQVSAVCMVSSRAGVQSAFFSALGFLHALAGGWHWLAVPVAHYFAFKSKPDAVLYLALYPVIFL